MKPVGDGAKRVRTFMPAILIAALVLSYHVRRNFMTTATVSGKAQVVIPAAIRRGLGIKPGTELEFELEGSSIRINLRQRVAPASLDAGYGMLKAGPSTNARLLKNFDAAQFTAQARGK